MYILISWNNFTEKFQLNYPQDTFKNFITNIVYMKIFLNE